MAKTSKNVNPEKNQSQDGKSVEKIPQKSRVKGQTPKQLMSEHIRDEKDVITDEEFKNLVVGTDMDIEKDTAHEPLDISEGKDRPKDEDKDKRIVTPWDVID